MYDVKHYWRRSSTDICLAGSDLVEGIHCTLEATQTNDTVGSKPGHGLRTLQGPLA